MRVQKLPNPRKVHFDSEVRQVGETLILGGWKWEVAEVLELHKDSYVYALKLVF